MTDQERRQYYEQGWHDPTPAEVFEYQQDRRYRQLREWQEAEERRRMGLWYWRLRYRVGRLARTVGRGLDRAIVSGPVLLVLGVANVALGVYAMASLLHSVAQDPAKMTMGQWVALVLLSVWLIRWAVRD